MMQIVNQILYAVAGAIALVVIIETLLVRIRPTARLAPAMALGLGLMVVAALATVGDNVSGVWDRVLVLQKLETRQWLWSTLTVLGGAIFIVGAQITRLILADPSREETFGVVSKKAQHETQRVEDRELLHSLVRNSISGVMVARAIRNPNRRIVDFECLLMNLQAQQLLGVSVKVLQGESILKHLPCLKDKGLLEAAISVAETKLPFTEEREIDQGDGNRWYKIAIAGHGDSIVAVFEDVSDRKKYEQQLRHKAEHDALTGLPSRMRLADRLQQAINRAKRVPDYKFAVLFLDFDRFKIINDTLGHDVGDQLLISISERLRANLRELDTSARLDEGHLPARLGGDEFVVLLDGISEFGDAMIVADRLQQALAEPHMLGEHEVTSTASIGIVTSEGGYNLPDDILRDADAAMYEAKHTGKARNVVFEERMRDAAKERVPVERDERR